jgi:hypothetical protein
MLAIDESPALRPVSGSRRLRRSGISGARSSKEMVRWTGWGGGVLGGRRKSARFTGLMFRGVSARASARFPEELVRRPEKGATFCVRLSAHLTLYPTKGSYPAPGSPEYLAQSYRGLPRKCDDAGAYAGSGFRRWSRMYCVRRPRSPTFMSALDADADL